MRVGTVTFATKQGLGYLAKSFHNAGVVTDVIVLHHGRRTTHTEWYPGSICLTQVSRLRSEEVREFVKTMDVMLFFETPFDWSLLPYCREHGVYTALMPMYECMPAKLPHQPDKFVCPSLLDVQYFPDRSGFIPIPVEMPWRQRTRACTFVHNAGHLGLRGRNGTLQVLQAMRYVKSPIQLTVRSQDVRGLKQILSQVPEIHEDQRVVVEEPASSRNAIWAKADVSLCAEKFNGLSLPLQEARASGMLVMTTNRYPANHWLPQDALIPVASYNRARVSPRCIEFDEAVVDPKEIAATVDDWYDQDISGYSKSAKYWAEGMSWKVLKPRYIDALSQW